MENRTMKQLLIIIGCISMFGNTLIGNALAMDVVQEGILIQNVIIIDGSGSDRLSGDVRILAGKITQIGQLEPMANEQVIDGKGQVLAPGFIDTHSHADLGIEDQRGALNAVSQGITTAIFGQDGGSHFPLSDFFQRLETNPVAINLASYAGHNTLRREVLGENFRRQATDGEIEAMAGMLEQEMKSGALGLGTGLEYEPGIWSASPEVMALAKVAAQYKGRYISHMRSEDRWFMEALDEIIEIGRVTGLPVQISHFKLALKSLWGRSGEVLDKLNAARAEGIDITADIYPYEYWQSNIMVLIPSKDLNDRPEFEFALTELAPPEGVWFSRFDPQPEYVGMKLTEIAELREIDPVTTLMQLAVEAQVTTLEGTRDTSRIIAISMREDDIHKLLSWPHTNVCTDGGLNDLHPRGAGSYPRVLGRYVREQGVLSLEQAIHKMTGLAAAHMGLANRGILQPGAAADLVLFDPDTVIDNATPEDTKALSSGITAVWVNGQIVYENGEVTGNYPGQVIRREN